MSEDRRHKYKVAAVRSTPISGESSLQMWTVEVRLWSTALTPAAQSAPTLTLQVESATQPYALGAVVELNPDWIMAPVSA